MPAGGQISVDGIRVGAGRLREVVDHGLLVGLGVDGGGVRGSRIPDVVGQDTEQRRQGGVVEVEAAGVAQDVGLFGLQRRCPLKQQRGVAVGVAGLGADVKVWISQLPERYAGAETGGLRGCDGVSVERHTGSRGSGAIGACQARARVSRAVPSSRRLLSSLGFGPVR